MEKENRPFSRECKQVEINCPKCGLLHVDVMVVGSILLRRRHQIEAFILKVHNENQHQGKPTDATNHS